MKSYVPLKIFLRFLEVRLQPSAANAFRPELVEIDDLQHLRVLLRAASLADTPEDFQKALNSNKN